MATFRSSLAVLLVAVTLCTCQALVAVNEERCNITVFAPPICVVCKCPPKIKCFCPALCRFVPGVVIPSNEKATLTVEKTEFPLAFLNVESGNVTYVVNTKDLKKIGFTSTVVVTGLSCGKGKQGIEALVFPSPKYYARFYAFKLICLMSGERYGT